MSRRRWRHVRKFCGCQRRRQPKCSHAWYFDWLPRDRTFANPQTKDGRWRFSLDAEFEQHSEAVSDAEEAARKVRAAIEAGTFRRAASAAGVGTAATTAVTLDQFAKTYVERGAQANGKATWKNDRGMLARLSAHRTPNDRRLGDSALSDITEDTIEAFFASLNGFAASTRNKYAQILKASFRWAAKKGYISRSPISDDSALKRGKVAQRRRRLSADEETALLKAAGELDSRVGFRLSGLVVAAVETGARKGELLALKFADVDVEKRTVFIRAAEEGARKTGRSRLLPMSTRLKAVIEMAKTDPSGNDYRSEQYVFGQLGERVRDVKKTWETAVLKAHSHEPKWARSALSSACRVELRRINLHFHDLRHEAGCRWLESGVPIHVVQQWLGHTNLAQTSTYLHADEIGSQEWMRRFDATRDKPPADAGSFHGNPVASSEKVAHPADCHDNDTDDGKDLLH
jgi:integrase